MIIWDSLLPRHQRGGLAHSITGRGVVLVMRQPTRKMLNIAAWLERVYDLFLGRISEPK
jgi:hypothetical protein